MNLDYIHKLCCQLQQISSTKEKQKFLIDNRCDDFVFFLRWLLDPAITTGIDKKKLKKKVNVDYVGEYIDFKSILNHLKGNNTGRDYDVAMCQWYINGNYEYADFLTAVFTKSLKLGVDVKLANKTYGKNFIPVHEVMLGSPWDKLRLKDGEDFTLTQKLNGIRCTYVDGKMISRQGKEFVGLEFIAEELNRFCPTFVFDGELIRRNVDGVSDNENFRLTTSAVNSEDGDKYSLEFVLFDCLPYCEFVNGKSSAKYLDRREFLDSLISKSQSDHLRIVPMYYQGNDQSMIEKCLAIVDNLGYEGLMLNKNNAPYECKRSTNLIKIKSFKHSDLKIVDVLEGEGKYVGMLGSIVVDYKGNTVNVGSGFTDEQRNQYWEIKDKLIDKIAQIKYKEVSKNKDTGFESLQFPVWICFRDDKTEPSYE